jgi:hypothetical protein
MDKFKIIVQRNGHDFWVNQTKVWGIYQHPTFNSGYMYLSAYWGAPGIYKIELISKEEDVEIWDNSTNEMLKVK